jgi:deoxycytidylate deaminase
MRFNSLIDRLLRHPNPYDIEIKISAIMMRGTKPVGNVCTNITRNYIKGLVCPAMHAETNAVSAHFGKKLRYSDKYGWILNKKVEKNLNIMVIRKKNDNTLGNARPCYKCTLMMQNIGINKVYYSMDNKLYCEKIKNMISVNISPSWKQIEIVNYNNFNDYIRSMVNKMPKITKLINAEYLVKHIDNEIIGCTYELTYESLKIYTNDGILFQIKIE